MFEWSLGEIIHVKGKGVLIEICFLIANRVYNRIKVHIDKEYRMKLLDNILNQVNQASNRKTKTYRDIAKMFKNDINELTLEAVYHLCEALLKRNNHPETIVAYQIIFDQRKRYGASTFNRFEQWMYDYVQDWWDCDDFMTHAFQYVLIQYPNNLSKIKAWVHHTRFAVRRSAAVILIVPARRGLIDKKLIFEVCDLLKNDTHYLVQKGYGWLLKEASKSYHDDVVKYLKENVQTMNRIAFRYALEKLPEDERKALMRL